MSNSSTYTTTSSEKLLSACGGALVTSVMVTPMDVIKMRLQTQNVYNNVPLALKNISCCLTFDRCSLTQALKFTTTTKKNNYNNNKQRRVQIANIHECALNHPSRNNPLIFKGTFVSLIFYYVTQNL
jgi:solute carrier family 25 protein 39/40